MIEFRYKCQCMHEEAIVMVKERTADQDVIEWIDFVVRPALGKDHDHRSPLCRAAKVEYLKIPFDDDKPIGSGKMQH